MPRISDIPFTPVAQKVWDKLAPSLDDKTWIICGSVNKNESLMEQLAMIIRAFGKHGYGLKALTPKCVPWYPAMSVEQKIDDILFYYKLVREGAGIVVANGDDYYGKATSLEVGHCLEFDKQIYFYNQPTLDDIESLALVCCGRAKVGLPTDLIEAQGPVM